MSSALAAPPGIGIAAPMVQARARRLYAIYGALAAGTLILAFARLLIGPWYQVYFPFGARLLEGWPAGWEVIYYLPHFPTFLGDAPPTHTIAPVHYRVLATLYAASALSVWTGSAYWALALVDLAFWFLAAVATYHLSARLGASEATALGAAALTLGSPLFGSSMWHHVFHPAEFASLALGLWAALALAAEERSARRLALGFGALLVWLSVMYQYQWVLLPMLAVLALSGGRWRWPQALAIVAGAAAVYAVGTALIRLVLAAARLEPATNPAAEYLEAVAQPGQLVAQRLDALASPAAALALLPGWRHAVAMAQAYHPLVFVVGVVGLAWLSWRVRLLAAVCTAVSLFSFSLYSAPWTAMTPYPLIYLGAGAACSALGRAAGRVAPRSGRLVTVAAVGVLMAITNLDLVGSSDFLLGWWRQYAVPPVT